MKNSPELFITVSEKNIQDIKHAISSYKTDNEKLEYAICSAGIYKTFYKFERIYGLILGTQISLLEFLYKNKGKAKFDDIASFVEDRLENFDMPQDGVNTMSLLAFLIRHELVCTPTSENIDNIIRKKIEYKITEKGVAFLTFLILEGHPNKSSEI